MVELVEQKTHKSRHGMPNQELDDDEHESSDVC